MSLKKLAFSLLLAATMPFLLNAASAQGAAIMVKSPGQQANMHSDWTNILSRYVHLHPDGVNRFDYGGLKNSETDTAILNDYIARLTSTQISDLPRDEKFAAYANLYNALTVRLIIENYPLESITKIRPGLFAIGPWKQKLITLEGKDLSLDDIEHTILRKEFDDPRVHYAVNCASMGCPNLQQKAWTAKTLDQDLEIAARDYINHPRGVTIRKDGRLQVSTIYRWFKEDFGGNEKGVIVHLLKFAEADLAAAIKANPDIADHKYDWSLNDTN